VIATSRPKRLEWTDGRLKIRMNGMYKKKIDEGIAYIGVLYKYLAMDKRKAGKASSNWLGGTESVDGEHRRL